MIPLVLSCFFASLCLYPLCLDWNYWVRNALVKARRFFCLAFCLLRMRCGMVKRNLLLTMLQRGEFTMMGTLLLFLPLMISGNGVLDDSVSHIYGNI